MRARARAMAGIGLVAALAAAPAAMAAVGSAGVGDKYFPLAGNGGYDVRHYRLALDYDPITDVLEGDARIRARTAERLRSFHLDYLGPAISELAVDGEPAEFKRNGQELIVTPTRAAQGPFVVRVTYSGTPRTVTDPDGSTEGWTTTVDGSAALGEPQGSPAWFPSNNHPTDKATYKFRVTVPIGITAVANGELVEAAPKGDGIEFIWRERDPMASYLAVLATGSFSLDDAEVAGIPSWIATDPLASSTDTSVMAEMHPFLASVYGPYPFDSTGAILDVNPTLGYALETQTRPYYSTPPGEATIVHEVAHQWVGNSVTLGRWKDIWLNEGFATYAEWLWEEEQGGDTPQQTFDGLNATPASNTGFWNPPPGDPKPEGMFDGTVYTRGAMALHAIRMEIGDADFFQLLRAWHDRYEGSHATTPKLLALAEEISGEQLDAVFDAWLYQPGKPS